MPLPLPLTLLLAIEAHAQTPTASEILLSRSNAPGSSIPNFGGDLVPTASSVSYLSYSATTTLNNATTALIATTSASVNESSSRSSRSSTTASYSLLQGSVGSPPSPLNATMTGNSSASRTSTSVTPTNTTPCNNYLEFCDRKYSNITMVGAHNSPFVNPNNAAANQELGVFAQLNDGIRMLQGQTHYNATTNTISYCHSSCNLLNVGTAQSFFTNVTTWIQNHPYDVVTILIGNADFIGVGNYSSPLEASGLSKYAYVPSHVPMNVSSWPTLASMILMGKRAVIFMEFSQMWETPFSPTNRSFPCTQQRPPGLSQQDAEGRMYMANHNLNTEISLGGTSLLVPTIALINETNAISGFGSLGLMANNCAGIDPSMVLALLFIMLTKVAAAWPRPPTFLLVDFYNQGSSPGSVFKVAAQHNNVTYNRACCGLLQTATSSSRPGSSGMLLTIVLIGASLYSLL